MTKKVAISLSLFSFLAMNFRLKTGGILIDIILTLALLFVVLKEKLWSGINRQVFSENLGITAFAGIVSIASGISFFYSWFYEIGLLDLREINYNSFRIKSMALAAVTVVFVPGCFFILNLVFRKLILDFPRESAGKLKHSSKLTSKLTVIEWAILLLTTVFCVTICSESSPIYPFNNWDDANAFFTLGKSVIHQKIIYKDLFEQKGPLLHFIYASGYLVSHDTFLGIYFLELISGFLFLLISYKTLRLFADAEIIFTVPIFAFIIFSSSALAHGGSAEEFCLPFVALSNYFGIKALKLNERISLKKWFVIGITSGVVFWIKYSLLGFYVGFGFVFAVYYMKRGWIKNLLRSIVSLITGVLITSLPVLFYFIQNDAVSDLFEAYFYDNIFIYAIDKYDNKLISLARNMFFGCSSFLEYYLLGFIMIVSGVIFLSGNLSRKKKSVLYYIVVTFFFSFFFIYAGGRFYDYYCFLFSLYVPLGVLYYFTIGKTIARDIKPYLQKIKYGRISYCAVVYNLCILLSFMLGRNTYLLKYNKEDLPQYQFDKYISQVENPTLLNYGFIDGGFYTVSNIVPNCKYFCIFAIPLDKAMMAQDEYVENELIDFVVTRDRPLTESQQVHYEFICLANFEEKKDQYFTYYLYKKR